MNKKPTLVYIDDEIENLRSFRLNFIDYFNIEIFESPLEFLDFLKKNYNLPISIVIADYRMPQIDGVTLLSEVKKILPMVRRIIISAYDDNKILLDAINRAQVHKYIIKPWDKASLITTLEEQIELFELTNELNKKYEELKQKNIELIEVKRKLEEENRILKSSRRIGLNLKPKIIEIDQQIKIIIMNPIMQQIWGKIERLKDNLDILFLTGEKGVGKKVIVKYLLYNSSYFKDKREKNQLIVLDAFQLKNNLISNIGKFIKEFLHEPIIFYITNLEELDLLTQKELLSILEDKIIVLDSDRIKLNQKIFVLSSTKSIESRLDNKLLEELLFFLSPYHLHIPSLRFRKDEIPTLISYYISLYSKEYKKDEPSISESTLQYLLRYKWPGNIDELKKNLKAAVLLADNEINQEHFSLLPNFFDEQFDSDDAKVSIYDLEFDKGDLNLEFMERIYQFKNGSLEELDYDKILDEFEKFVFQIALNKTYGNKAKAASLLNLKPGKFLYKTKYLGL